MDWNDLAAAVLYFGMWEILLFADRHLLR
jgi:hypothetical protein